MNFDKNKIIKELLKSINLKLRRDVRIAADLHGAALSVYIIAGFDQTTIEHQKTVDLNDPDSLNTLENWLTETLLEINYA